MSGPSKKKSCPTRRPSYAPQPFEGPWLPVYFDELQNDELPKLLVETCFSAGHPYTAVAFTLACVSKEFKRAADTQSDACLDKLRSLYDDWRQKRTLWVRAFRRAEPDGAGNRPPVHVQPELDNVTVAWSNQVKQALHVFGEERTTMITRHLGKTDHNKLRVGGSIGYNKRSLEEASPISFTWSKMLLCNLAKDQCMVCTGSGVSCVTCGRSKGKTILIVGRISYSGATMTFRDCCLDRRTIPVTLTTNPDRETRGATVATASMDWVTKRPGGAAKMNCKQMLAVTDNDPTSNAVHLAMCMAKISLGTYLTHPDVLERLSPQAEDPFWSGPEDKDQFRGRLFLYPNVYADRRDCFSTRIGIRAGSGIEKAAERLYMARQEAAASLRKAAEDAVFEMAKQRVMPTAAHLVADCEELIEQMPLLSKTIRVLANKKISTAHGNGTPYMTGRIDETLATLLEYGILDRVKSTIERASRCAVLDAKWAEAGDTKQKASKDAMNWALCLHPSYINEYSCKQVFPEGFLADLMNMYKPDVWPRTATIYEVTAFHVFDAILAGSVKISFAYESLAVNRSFKAGAGRGRLSNGYKMNTQLSDPGYSRLSRDDGELYLIANFSWTSGPGASRPFMWARVRIASDDRDQAKRMAHLKNSQRMETDQPALDRIKKLLSIYKPGMHYSMPPQEAVTQKNLERLRKWHEDLFAEAIKDGESLTVAMHATGMVWEHLCCAIDTAWLENEAWRLDNPEVQAWAPDFGTPERFCAYLLKRMAGEADFCAAATMDGLPNETRMGEAFNGPCARYLNKLYECRYMPTSPSYSPTSPQYDAGHSAAGPASDGLASDEDAGPPEESDEEGPLIWLGEESGDESGDESEH